MPPSAQEIDVPNETVVLAAEQPKQLAVPPSSPCYLLYRHAAGLVLVYSCPPSSPVKSRLLYSSAVLIFCKRAVPEWTGLSIIKKVSPRLTHFHSRFGRAFVLTLTLKPRSAKRPTRLRSPPSGSIWNWEASPHHPQNRVLVSPLPNPRAQVRTRAGRRRPSRNLRSNSHGRHARDDGDSPFVCRAAVQAS